MVLEEQTSNGPSDSSPMTLFQLVHTLERKGILDLTLTGHTADRPASVKRGEESDRLEVVHQSYSLFKPNAVTAKAAKSTNVAGLAGYKVLKASNYLELVWRILVQPSNDGCLLIFLRLNLKPTFETPLDNTIFKFTYIFIQNIS